MRKIAAIALCCFLSPWALSGAQDAPYNSGVAAYKKKNYQEAISQWTLSAAQGNVDALNNLGYLLYNGLGTAKNVDDAIRLWRTASYAGHSEAQWHLASVYESGQGIEQDLSKAYAWYRCSIESATRKLTHDNSDVEANILNDSKDSLAKLATKLSVAERKQGEVLAADYIARYGRPAP